LSIKIRLRRTGTRKQPHYRLVVADALSPRDGRFIEVIGHYHPMGDPPELVIQDDRALMWLKRGAQPTVTARALLKRGGVWRAFTADKPSAAPRRKRLRPGRAGAQAGAAAPPETSETPSE
jgi:small subunit ribosomal protein S16